MRKTTFSALIVLAATAHASGALAQDAAAGKTSFNKCLACHAIGDGAKNKVGPELNGLDGRKSGTAAGYSYSTPTRIPALPEQGRVPRIHQGPEGQDSGTKMAFAGIKNEKEANDLWAYIVQYGPTERRSSEGAGPRRNAHPPDAKTK
jgi:cytochrome c